MKQRILGLFLAAALAAGITACGNSTQAPASDTSKSNGTETEAEKEDVPDTWYISPSHTGKLKVANGTLCDQEGNPVQLAGLSTHAITRCDGFLNEDFFKEMRVDWGVNVVRLAMYTAEMDGYNKSDYYKQKNTELVQKGVELASKYDLYAIVDWHILSDKTPLQFKNEALAFFDQMSRDYKDHNNVIYEICNEPNNTPWADIKAYANEVIPVIRANDPDALIICGTPEWSQRVDEALADPLEFDNVMYTLHFYSASHKEELRNRMVECSKAGLPIFVTEYGVTASNGSFPRDLEEADLWMQALNENNISHCMWGISRNGEACNVFSPQAKKYKGFTEEDYNETGVWFMDMIASYKAKAEIQ